MISLCYQLLRVFIQVKEAVRHLLVKRRRRSLLLCSRKPQGDFGPRQRAPIGDGNYSLNLTRRNT